MHTNLVIRRNIVITTSQLIQLTSLVIQVLLIPMMLLVRLADKSREKERPADWTSYPIVVADANVNRIA